MTWPPVLTQVHSGKPPSCLQRGGTRVLPGLQSAGQEKDGWSLLRRRCDTGSAGDEAAGGALHASPHSSGITSGSSGKLKLGSCCVTTQGCRGLWVVEFDPPGGAAWRAVSSHRELVCSLDMVSHTGDHRIHLLSGDAVLSPWEPDLRRYGPGRVTEVSAGCRDGRGGAEAKDEDTSTSGEGVFIR